MYDFLEWKALRHSSTGTSWEKKDHKYVKKYRNANGKWVYVYATTREGRNKADAYLQSESEKRWQSNQIKVRSINARDQKKAEFRWGVNKQKAKTYKPNTNPKTAGALVKKGKLWVSKHLIRLAKDVANS